MNKQKALEKCIQKLQQERADIIALLLEAEIKARKACETDDRKETARLLHEACDAEFDALFNCDATGGLTEDLGVTDEEMDEQECECEHD